MADSTVKVGLEVSDNGSAGKTTQNVQKLKDVLDTTTSAAKNTSKAIASMRGTGAGGATSQKIRSASESSVDLIDYNRMRGAAGVTGASGRDFAEQSKGLSGLVRLYAVYAANIFAASAAFNALSKAMDTTNMVRGLDQLGAASGVALGTLSKRLVAATDGAISLREAMSATAKAVSSGMNSQDVLRLGKVAKQASQALGVDMSDAVNRLTRGITKLEPELLDELGIFTKIDPAVQEYAKSINKTASELSDFERRQAFAIAVLKEGEKKFSEIDIDTNPYTKLTANLQNLAQTALEIVNKALVPVVKFLNENPTALAVAIAGLAALLVKQAIPAITEWKSELRNAAEGAAAKAKEDLDLFRNYQTSMMDQARQGISDSAKAQQLAAEQGMAGVRETMKNGVKLYSKEFQALLKKDISALTAGDLAALDKVGKAYEKAAGKAFADTPEGRAAQQKAQERLDLFKKLDPEIRKAIQNQENYNKELAKQVPTNLGVQGRLLETIAKNTDIASKKMIILANAADNASFSGPLSAFASMSIAIKNLGDQVGIVGKGLLYFRGILAITAATIGVVTSALGNLLGVIGIVTGVVTLLDTLFSTAGKQMAAFDGSIEELSSSVDTLGKTFKKAYQDNPFTASSLQAQSTAILEIANSFKKLAESATDAQKAVAGGGMWDKAKEGIKDLFGFGVGDKFREELVSSITKTVRGLEGSPEGEEIKQRLQNILSIKDVGNVQELEKATKNLQPTSQIVKELGNAFLQVGTKAAIAASKAKEFSDAFKDAQDTFKEITKQFEVNDPLTRFATKSIVALTKLKESLDQGIVKSIGSIQTLLNGLKETPIFGIEVSKNVLKLKDSFGESSTELQRLKKELFNSQQQLSALLETGDELTTIQVEGGSKRGLRKEGLDFKRDKDALEAAVQKAELAIPKIEGRLGRISAELNGSISDGLDKALGDIGTGIAASLAKSSGKFLNAIYSAVDNIPEFAERQFDLKLKEINSQETLIRVNKSLAEATRELAAETALSNAKAKVKSAEKAVQEAEQESPEKGVGKFALGQRKLELEKAKKEEAAAEKGRNIIKTAASQPLQALKDAREMIRGGDEEIRKYAESVARAATESAGFNAQLQELAESRKIVQKIEKPLGVLKAEQKVKQEELDVRIKTNSVALEELKNTQQRGEINALDLLQEEEKLRLKAIGLDLESKLKSINDEVANKQIFINALLEAASQEKNKAKRADLQAQAERLKTRTEETRASAVDLANREAAAKTDAERLKTDKDRLKIAKDILDFASKTDELERDLIKLKSDFELTSAERLLDLEEKTGRLTEDQVKERKKLLEVKKTEVELQSKLESIIEKERKAIDALNAEVKNSAGTITDSEISRRLNLIIEAGREERRQAIETKDFKIKQLDEIFEYEKSKVLREGVADAIETALFEGGKAGRKKLRDVIVAELRKPISIVVKAIIDPVTNAVSSAVSGITNSLMSSIGTSLFGSTLGSGGIGAGLATAAGQFGSGLVAGVKSAFMTGGEVAMFGEMGVAGTTGAFGAGASISSSLMAAGPYIAIAAAVLSFLGAFSKTELKGTGLTGTLGMGDIKDVKSFREGGKLGGPDWYNVIGETSAVSKQLQSTYDTMRKSVAAMAESLGLAGDSIRTFTQSLGEEGTVDILALRTEGLTPEQIQEKIAKRLEAANETLAQQALMIEKKVLVPLVERISTGTQTFWREYGDGVIESQEETFADIDTGRLVEQIVKVRSEFWREGETALQALTRMSASLNTVNSVLKAFNMSLLGISLQSGETASKLVESFGGLENFVNQTKSFYDNFFTETQRIASTTSGLVEQFEKLNIAAPESKQGFQDIVKGIDINTDAGRQLFTTLMALQGPILEVLNYEEQLANSRKDQEIAILELLDTEDSRKKALDIQRKRELDALDPSLRAGQIYINALQDEQAIREKLITTQNEQVSALEQSISKTRGFIESLKDYKNQLLGGPLTVLGPQAQYEQKRALALETISRARLEGTDPETVRLREQALTDLPNALTGFLESSRNLFASSSTYAEDFAVATGALDATGVQLTTQLTAEEQALKTAKESLSSLQSIEESSSMSAEQLKSIYEQLELARQATEAARQAWVVQTEAAPTQTLAGQVAYEMSKPDVTILPVPGGASIASADTTTSSSLSSATSSGSTSAEISAVIPVSSSAVDTAMPISSASTIIPTTYELSNTAADTLTTYQEKEIPTLEPIVISDQSLVAVTKQIVETLENVVTEIQTLQEQQIEQTGALILAQQEASTTVADAVVTTAEDTTLTESYSYKVAEKVTDTQ